MKVVFRADASLQIGTGHVMRCLTLADALAARGANCQFISRAHPGNLIEFVRSRGYIVRALPEPPAGIEADLRADPAQWVAHSHWLGVTQAQDAEACASILADLQPDWLIMDHYGLDITWEETLQPFYKHLMVIDDLADRKHLCELLLDQNLGREHQDYAGLVPSGCKLMVGPHYALLRPEFAELRDFSLKRREEPSVEQVLISMGGVDPDNVTGRILSSLRGCPLNKNCRIVVVMGRNAPWLQHIKQQAADLPWPAEVLVDIQDMAKKMAESDLSIGAAGSTSWERCCLGLPSIVVVLAENQKNVARFLSQKKVALVVDLNSIENELPKYFEYASPSILKLLSDRSSQVTAGDGAEKVIQQIMLR